MADDTTPDVPAPIVGGNVVVQPDAPSDPPADDLGEAGKKALEQERKARRDAEKAAKTAQSALEKAQREAMGDQERAVAEARDAGRTEALSLANSRLLAAEVKSSAAGRLTNPDLAVRLLDLDKFEVGDDGTVDSNAISSAIDELLESDPYLASGATPLRVTPTPIPSGARGGTQPVDGNDWLRDQRNRRR